MTETPRRRALRGALLPAAVALVAGAAGLATARLAAPACLAGPPAARVGARAPLERPLEHDFDPEASDNGGLEPEVGLDGSLDSGLDGEPDGAFDAEGEPDRPGGVVRRAGEEQEGEARTPGVVALGSRSFVVEQQWLEQALAAGFGGVGAEPVQAEGRVSGYRLSGVAGSPLARLGLREGDVLTAVGGRPLGSPGGASEVYRRHAGSSRVQVTVRRRGVPISFTYRIE